MNTQQRAAMQMALDALEALITHNSYWWQELDENIVGNLENSIPALREALRNASERMARPQGEWVDLTDDEVVALEREVGCFAIGQLGAVITKFKKKNTPPVVPQGEPVAYGCFANGKLYSEALLKPSGAFQIPLYTKPVVKQSLTTQAPVVPQGEPVAWIHRYKTGAEQINTAPPETYVSWSHTPLYTTPPSVEAMRIETLEKAAKKCEGLFADAIFDAQTAGVVGMVVNKIAAAIRSMK